MYDARSLMQGRVLSPPYACIMYDEMLVRVREKGEACREPRVGSRVVYQARALLQFSFHQKRATNGIQPDGCLTRRGTTTLDDASGDLRPSRLLLSTLWCSMISDRSNYALYIYFTFFFSGVFFLFPFSFFDSSVPVCGAGRQLAPYS